MIPKTVFQFWRNEEERTGKLSALWLICCAGKVQPEGYIIGWNVRKRHAAKALREYCERTGDSAYLLRLVPS